MGCVSSALLNQQHEDFRSRQMEGGGSSSSFGHHIVCLTSSTYGRLLSLDPPSPPPITSSEPEIINSWELMAGLDLISNNNESSFRGFPRPKKPFVEIVEDDDDEDKKDKENSNLNPTAMTSTTTSCDGDDEVKKDKENSDPNENSDSSGGGGPVLSSSDVGLQSYHSKMKVVCRPPKGGEDKVVVYTTSLGTVRKTLE